LNFRRYNCNSICFSPDPPRSRSQDEVRRARDLLRETSVRENREGPEAGRANRPQGRCNPQEGESEGRKAYIAGQVSESLVKASGSP